MGYAAHEVEYAVVEVDVDTLEGTLTLSRRVSVWNAVNGGYARVVEAQDRG